MNFRGFGSIGRIYHGALFHLRDLGRDADDNAWVHKRPALMRLLHKVAEHLLGHFEVGNHAILQRFNNSDCAGRAAEHLLGFLSDRLHFTGAVVEGNS